MSYVVVVSHCSINPAALVVVSNVHGRVVSTTSKVVAVPVISAAEGATFEPLHVFTSDPKTCRWVTSVICWVVVVVEFILPVVNWGVTVLALAMLGDNRAKSRINFFMLLVLVYLP